MKKLDPKRLRKVSAWVTALATLALLAWDIVPYINPAKGDTISEVVRDWSKSFPAVPYFLGVVAGHWLWTWPGTVGGTSARGALLVLSILSMIGASIAAAVAGVTLPRWVRIAVFVLGFVAGHYLWALED